MAQLYMRDVAASVTRPVKELKGFQRVTLRPGEKRRVNRSITIFGQSAGRWTRGRGEPGTRAERGRTARQGSFPAGAWSVTARHQPCTGIRALASSGRP